MVGTRLAFPGFANGGVCATHVDMRMRRNASAHLRGHNGFCSFTRSNPARFAVRSYPKQRVLHSSPRALRMLVVAGGEGVEHPN